MIHTIRKHSKWLLWIVSSLVIFAFVVFMGIGPARSGAGASSVNTNEIGGEIYGQKVTQDMYEKMHTEVDFDFLFRYGQWPEQNPQMTPQMLQQSIYVRMMEVEKARQLGVHVTDAQAEKAAAGFLSSPALQRAFGVHDQAVPFSSFVGQVLGPKGFTEDDFANFIRDDLAIQQLQTLFGIPGELLTPQEAINEYIRENQEYSAQIIFFSASNYLDRVSVSPADVGNYYTNYMADYRLPARVKVDYVVFSASNYMADAQRQIGGSNLELQVQNIFQKYGMQATPDAKSTNEALLDIRNVLLRHQALQNAATQADTFAQSVFNVTPVSSGNLATVARQKGLAVEHPAPFSEDYGPAEFSAPPAFTQAAFKELRPDAPISEPVAGPDGIYILALQTNLPSEIPPLDKIRSKVTDDLRMRLATITAERAGTNFASQLPVQMAAGKSFAAVGFAARLDPLVLPPFSLSTEDVPELGDHATLNQLKEVALTTPTGTASSFMQTDDGGFILYVQSRLPVDREKMAADMAQFTADLRDRRAQQAYSDWMQHEANRQLRSTPLARQMGMR